MDTQNTPIHIKLWHRDFWRLCFANLLLMTSVCMLIIGIPYFMTQGFKPKFLRHFAQVGEEMQKGVKAYIDAVKSTEYPSVEESY